MKPETEYPHLRYLEYSYKEKIIQFSILTKEIVDYHLLRNLIFDKYLNYINEHPSKKVSKNNIIKFLNDNGVDCVNRAYFKNKKNG